MNNNKLFLSVLFFTGKLFSQTIAPITITSQSLNITGSLTVANWAKDHPSEQYPNYPKLYYAFAEGDEILIDFSTENKKGTQIIEVVDYNSKSILYSNKSIQNLEGFRLKIPRTSIYQFEFATNHIFDRQCNVTLKRIPALPDSKFNHNVVWRTIQDTSFFTTEVEQKTNTTYEAISIQQPSNYFINGGFNATMAGGKSRITFPITLPPNTIEWYYSFSATRDKNNVESTQKQMHLLADLTKFMGAGILTIALNGLSTAPGANYCDVYLLPAEYFRLFENKEDGKWRYITEASRENIMSGVVNVRNCCKSGSYYIGLKNPSAGYGIHVIIEVVAIVEKFTLEKVKVKTPLSIKTIRIPSLQE